jgi:hypothetical protein
MDFFTDSPIYQGNNTPGTPYEDGMQLQQETGPAGLTGETGRKKDRAAPRCVKAGETLHKENCRQETCLAGMLSEALKQEKTTAESNGGFFVFMDTVPN